MGGGILKRLKIFTWHIHGSYLYYLSHIPHDIYIPKKDNPPNGYIGITPSYPWPANLHEIPAEDVKNYQFDCVLYQHHDNYLRDQFATLSAEQRELPRIYLEHDPPRDTPTDTIHPVNDPNILVVHVTDFNRLMWDCRKSPTKTIDHGITVPKDAIYKGDLDKGIVVVNNIHKRGRRLGLDLYLDARKEIELDLYGMGWKEAGGKGELPHSELPYVCSRYRYFYNPIRYTSLGLSILEAMMIGMPIIGLATAELATVIKNDYSGLISTRPEDLIIASKELLKSPGLAKKWGEGARKSAMERFSIERFVRDWNRTLKEVVGVADIAKEQSWTSL
jgi:glycosyltransferase involved in cell wall biosynthesis